MIPFAEENMCTPMPYKVTIAKSGIVRRTDSEPSEILDCLFDFADIVRSKVCRSYSIMQQLVPLGSSTMRGLGEIPEISYLKAGGVLPDGLECSS
jgi:hypothetical protein